MLEEGRETEGIESETIRTVAMESLHTYVEICPPVAVERFIFLFIQHGVSFATLFLPLIG